jgi:hypothetical protein
MIDYARPRVTPTVWLLCLGKSDAMKRQPCGLEKNPDTDQQLNAGVQKRRWSGLAIGARGVNAWRWPMRALPLGHEHV